MDAFISFISYFGCNFAPVNWGFCNGAIIGINQFQALYSLIGTAFGGDGRTTMGLPDLRARVPVGSLDMGQPPGLQGFVRGQKAGAQTQILTTSQMPTHTHSATFTPGGSSSGTVNMDVKFKANSAAATTHSPGSNDPSGNPALSLAAPVSGLVNAFGYNASTPDVALDGVEASGTVSGITVNGTIDVGPSGGSSDFEILNPIQAMNACICLSGIYPSRN